MTNFKKTVALILSVVMVLSAMSFSFADDKLNNSGDIGGIIDNYDEVEPQEDVSKGEDLVDDEPSEGDEEPAKGDEEPAKGDEEPIEVEPAENENEITEEQQPECDCGAAEGDTHSEQCAVNAAEEQPVEDKLVDERPECDCGAAEGEPHAQDCPLAEEDIEGSTADELVTEQLEALPKADELDAEEASEDDELIEDVEAARDAYDDLSEQEQQNINEELLANLDELEMLCGLVDMPLMMAAPQNVNYPVWYNDYGYDTIGEAIAAAKNSGDGLITLRDDIETDEIIVIDTPVTIDGNAGNGDRYTITGTAAKVFEINGAGYSASDKLKVKFANVEIVSEANKGRCIDTRTGGIELALENVSLGAGKSASQPLTVGGDGYADYVANGIYIKDSTINAGDSGYAVIIFNPVDMTVDNTKISGYCSLYFKSNNDTYGAAGSDVKIIKGSELTSEDKEGESNSFATIVFATTGITLEVDESSIVKKEEPAPNNIAIGMWVGTVAAEDNTNTITVRGTVTGGIWDAAVNGNGIENNITVKAEYADMLMEAGFATLPAAEEGMIRITDMKDDGDEALMNGIFYETLEDAVAAANLSENDVVIKLYNDCVVDKALVIKNDNGAVITIDGDKGNGGKYSVVGSDKKVFEVWSDVTFKNVVINNTYTKANARCIDTRTGDIELNVENSELYANTKGYNQQVINIGGKGKNIVANIKGSTITASNNGYGITVYNPVELTLSDFTTSSGYAALYLKAPDNSYGAGGSVVNVMGGTLNGASVSGESFGTISIETTGITVNVDESSTVTAAEGAGANAAIFISDTYMTADVSDGVNNITIKGTINGDILSGDVFTGNTANNIVVKKEYGSKLTDAGYYFVEYSDADYILLSTKVADAVAEAITAANAVLADADATDTEDHLKNPTLATITDAELEDIDVDNMLRDHKDELSAIVFKLENAVSAEELDEYLSKNASERKQIERLYKLCEIAFTVLEHASDVEVDESIVTDAVIPELPANAPEGTAAPTKQQTEEAVQGMVDDLTNNDAVNSTAPDGLAEAFEGGGDVSLTIKVQLLGIDVEAVIGADNKLDIVPSVLHFEVTPYKHKIDVENDNEFIGRETPVPNDALKGKGYNITFRLPIPDSITEKYAKVEHEGDAAKYLPIETENGHKFIVLSAYHFSEFKVTFTDKLPYSSSGGGHSTGGAEGKNEEIEAFWEEVEADIKKAKDGDTVRVDAKIKDQMPYTIMTALLDNPGVTLTVKWNEGSVTIPAGRALTPESNRIYYPLDYLAKIYENIDAIPVVKQEPVAPNGGYDKPKNYPVPAPAPAVPTEDREQSASAEKPEVKEPEATQPEIKQPEPPAEVVTVAPAEAERMQLNYPLIAAIVGGVAVLSILVFAIAKMRKGKEY